MDLISTGLLIREANGRVSARMPTDNQAMQIGLLVPSLASPDVEAWRLALIGSPARSEPLLAPSCTFTGRIRFSRRRSRR